MDWLHNKYVRLVCAIVFAVSALILVAGGVTPEVLNDLIVKVIAIATGIYELIAAIIDIIIPKK